jgi:Flp pilus assembly protein TadG
MTKTCLRSQFRRFIRDPAGTSAVEFALLSPLFFLVFFGLTAYGIYLGASHSLQQIAADAARVSVAGLSNEERTRLALDYVSANAADYPLVDPERVTARAYSKTGDATQFVVSVALDASDLPIWGLFRGLPLPGTTIEHHSTIRIGGL